MDIANGTYPKTILIRPKNDTYIDIDNCEILIYNDNINYDELIKQYNILIDGRLYHFIVYLFTKYQTDLFIYDSTIGRIQTIYEFCSSTFQIPVYTLNIELMMLLLIVHDFIRYIAYLYNIPWNITDLLDCIDYTIPIGVRITKTLLKYCQKKCVVNSQGNGANGTGSTGSIMNDILRSNGSFSVSQAATSGNMPTVSRIQRNDRFRNGAILGYNTSQQDINTSHVNQILAAFHQTYPMKHHVYSKSLWLSQNSFTKYELLTAIAIMCNSNFCFVLA